MKLTGESDALLRLAVRAFVHDAILPYIFNSGFVEKPPRFRGAGFKQLREEPQSTDEFEN